MNGECYFCHGIVSAAEEGHIWLREHDSHEVYMHEQCASGHNVIEGEQDPAGELLITCPECGAVETI